MHPLTEAMFSLLPAKSSIKYIFGEKLNKQEIVEINISDITKNRQRANRLNDEIKNLSGYESVSTFINLREKEIFIVFYTKADEKRYIEFYDGLNNPSVES